MKKHIITKTPTQQTEDVQAPSSNVRNASADNGVSKRETAHRINGVERARSLCSENSSSSDNTIPQGDNIVNTYNTQNTEINAGVVKNEVSERFRSVRPKYHAVLDGIGKKLNAKILIDEEIEGSDGYWEPKTRELHINANAQNPIKEVIKHEITHVLEGTKAYDDLVSFMRENFKEEWAEKENAIKGLYERVNVSRELKGEERIELKPERLKREVMAELSEKFESDEFLERVSRENPTMIDKIRDFIKDVIARLKGVFSSQELKRWQEAEKKWENAFLNADTTAREGDVKYSISYTKEKTPVLVVNDDIVRESSNEKDLIRLVKKSLGRYKKVPIKGQSVYFVRDTKREFTASRYTEKIKRAQNNVYQDKMRVAAHPQEIIYATTSYVNEELNHPRKDDIIDFARGNILIDVSGRKYSAEVVIGFTKKGICELHDIVNIIPTNFEYKKIHQESIDLKNKSDRQDVSSNNRVAQKASVVNSNSMQNSKNNSEIERKLQEPIDIDAEYGNYVAAVEAENAEIKELNESLKREIMSGRRLKRNPARVNELVERIIKKDYKSTVNVKETAGAVQEILEKMIDLFDRGLSAEAFLTCPSR